ncbi:hypothetical protein NL441_18825, partial [Klebsiella pneumoniae]|nr:hypothetical protein [Klebsiella pneumoniae]
GMVCVVGRMRDLILQLSKSSIYSTKPNKVVGFISEDKEKPDTHLNLPLIENSSKHGSDLMANKPEEGEKVSERLHVTFKIPIWLIALIVVMIVINIIVLVVLNR